MEQFLAYNFEANDDFVVCLIEYNYSAHAVDLKPSKDCNQFSQSLVRVKVTRIN